MPFVDAPVLGTKAPAEQGKLIVLASGPEDGASACEPVFDAVGAKTLWLGEAGAGTRIKLVLNTWLLALIEGLAEAIALAEAPRRRPADVPRHHRRRPDGRALREAQGQADDRARLPAELPARARAKDAAARARRGARSRGSSSRAGARSSSRWSARSSAGHGEEDMAATIHASRGRALIIVDYQNDFAPPGGALSVPGGRRDRRAHQRAGRARATTTSSSRRATGTRPTTARSPSRAGPGRCTACRARAGAELHPALDAGADRRDRRQGPGPAAPRATRLRRHRPRGDCCASAASTQVTVVGLATDYCVKNTALDALREGFAVTRRQQRRSAASTSSRATPSAPSTSCAAAGATVA